mmetsp:Transcript_86597/g.173277  ORF Transcript_86597/g.173277 Transcript_86597/m.173277 type:complete len:86 (+) Transcript_86597:324-581(+)
MYSPLYPHGDAAEITVTFISFHTTIVGVLGFSSGLLVINLVRTTAKKKRRKKEKEVTGSKMTKSHLIQQRHINKHFPANPSCIWG